MLTDFPGAVQGLLSRLRRDRKGAALVEYALLVAGIALIALVAVAILGEKTGGMIGALASILPGAHGDDNGAIVVGALVEKKLDGNNVVLDVDRIANNAGSPRLGNNLGGSLDKLVIDSSDLNNGTGP